MKTLAMIKYTLYEYLHGVGFFILLFVFGMIFVVFGVGLSVEETLTGEKAMIFGTELPFPTELTSDTGGACALIIQLAFALMATSLWGPIFFMFMGSRSVESLLTQGNRYLLLSKPMHRCHIFLSRLGGFMLFSAIVLYLFLGGLWLIVGIKTGYFIYQPFAAIPLILLLYLSLISIIALLTVLVENFFVAAGVTTGFYFVTTVLGQLEYVFDENPTMHFGWVIIHGALPRIGELTAAVNSLYQPNEPVEWVSPVLITLLFSAVVLTAATFLFWRKEY